MSKSKIAQLEQEIIKHKNLYYQGKAVISDFEYDAIEDELKKIDKKHTKTTKKKIKNK